MRDTTDAPGAGEPAGEPPREGMAWVPGGDFLMGSDDHYPEEAPAQLRKRADGFWIDRCAVTNDEFARFVQATGHVTLAEQVLDAADYPDARELLVAGSSVFRRPGHPVDLRDAIGWWAWCSAPAGATRAVWQSSVRGLGDHPVVHVAWSDIEAYAAWAGKDLPSEAEGAGARGGLDGAEFAWGDELTPGGRHMANVAGRPPTTTRSTTAGSTRPPPAPFRPTGTACSR